METYLSCIKCAKRYTSEEIRYKCDCGGLLEACRDLSKFSGRRLVEKWEKRRLAKRGVDASGVWRYRELIFDVSEEMIVTREEGNTRLYDSGGAGKYAGLRNFLLKHEGENPTGSFKDRGMTCGVTAATSSTPRCG